MGARLSLFKLEFQNKNPFHKGSMANIKAEISWEYILLLIISIQHNLHNSKLADFISIYAFSPSAYPKIPWAIGRLATSSVYEPAISPRTVHEAQNDRQPQSPRMVCLDPNVSQLKKHSPILKTKPFSRTLPKAALWRQQERGATEYKAEEQPPSASFYADIQTWIRGPNLSECNKDLRALRILGALHIKDTPCQSDTDGSFVPIQKTEDVLKTSAC